jgi:hypothetical protein
MKITVSLDYDERPLGYKYCLYSIVGLYGTDIYFNKEDLAEVFKCINLLGAENATARLFRYTDAHKLIHKSKYGGYEFDEDSHEYHYEVIKLLLDIQKGEI